VTPGVRRYTYTRATLIHVKQNLTLALPVDVVRRLKVLAAERNSSISKMLTERLEEILRRDDEYERGTRRILSHFQQGFDLGTQGRRTWTRDELHER
jgi:predicted transcriptional regulator